MIDNPQPFLEIDSSLFKAFVVAAHELNFTKAARVAAMTQSGVSQHIAKLESQVGAPLFQRINKSVRLTHAGRLLLLHIEFQQEKLATFFERIGEEIRVLSGTVRYAMPHSCLFTPHFPLLLEGRRGFPQVGLRVDLCPNHEVIKKLLKQEIDFGFVTRTFKNPALQHDLFAVEQYVLVGHRELIAGKPFEAREILGKPFVDYPGMQAIFEIWKNRSFPNSRRLNYENLRILGRINSLHGAITMISKGMGLSVVPRHVVDEQIGKKEILIYPGAGKKEVLSEIFIVTLKDQLVPRRVQTLLQIFHDMKKV